MPARKKPVPSYSESLEEELSTYNASSNGHSRDPSPVAASHTMRHALQELTPPPQFLGADDHNDTTQSINHATDGSFSSSSSHRRSLPVPVTPNRLIQRHSASPQTPRTGNSPGYAQYGASPALDRVEAGRFDENERTGMLQSHNSHTSSTTSFLPRLPTMDMGEPLKWDGFVSRSSLHDPFTDSAAGIRSSLISNQSRPVSTVSSYHDAISTHTPQITGQTQGYTASQLPSVTPNRQYQPLRNSTVAGSPLDHFRRDSEALLSSGSHQRGSWVNLSRSRSPTPRRDKRDEDEVDEKLDSEGESEDGDELDDLPTQTVQARLPTSTSTALPAADGEKTPSSSVFTQSTASALVETRHFGPAPTGRVLRRHKTKKRVSLTNGNLVVDIPVPPNLVLPRKGDLEVMKMRYTAVTCDPDEFEKNGFFLRQNEAGRKTELFICVTMFNEDEILFCRTLYGVMQNIAHLCSRKNSQTWGNEAWKKVVVCIVADGRKKVHPRVLDCLTLLGVYQPGGHMKNMINNKPVTAHVFEYTTSFALDPNLHFRYPDKGIVPTQIIFCMKEKNQKKINSHRWFFNAFGSMLQPNVCVLLDVGTRPKRKSIYHLWKAFDLNSNVAGACGEIAAYKGKNWSALLNPLVAAQNFEYKISCILDKPTESLFGYISVLPGAFSAYRYIALQNNSTGQGPLASYFKGEVLHGRDTDIFTSNMYLAEDRILCFELVAKANSNWVLRYVKSAVSETDVPDALPEFISQRRRWLNGSFFAATYAIAHVGQMLRSGHSFWRKFALLIQVGYNVLNLISSWFAIGNFYLFFVILTSSLEASTFNLNGIARFNSIVQYIMGSIVIACFLFSMGNKPRSAAWKYKLVSIFLAVLMVYLLAAAVLCAIAASRNGDKAYTVMWFSLIITYGVYIFSSFLAFDPWHMFTSFVPYMLLSPTYVNVLNIYAFSNLDDISWGTKEDNVPDTDLGAVIQDAQSKVDVEFFAEAADANALYEESIQNLKNRTPVNKGNNKAGMTTAEKEQAAKEYYAGVRTNVLLAWVLSNALLLVGILGGSQSTDTFSGGTLTAAKAYLTFVLCFVALTSIIRLSGSTMYLLARVFTG